MPRIKGQPAVNYGDGRCLSSSCSVGVCWWPGGIGAIHRIKKKEAVEDRKMSRPVTIFISFLWLGLGAALVSADGAHSISDWDSD